MKRMVFFAVFLVVLAACFGCAADKLTDGDWEYETEGYGDTKTVRITKYAPAGEVPEVLEVPEKLGGYPVRELRSSSLSNVYREENGKTEQVPGPKILVLPAGLKKIDVGSIRFNDLEEIRIENGENYETRDGVLFETRTHTLMTYPRNRENTPYTVPEGTLVIGSYAFEYSENPHEVILADSVRRIENNAFRIHELHLTIPEGIEKIEPGAVIWASRFISRSPRYQVVNGLLVDSEEKALLSVPQYPYDRDRKTWIVKIPEGVETIEYNAIDGVDCYQVVFPSTLKTIKKSNDFYRIYSGSMTFPEGLERIGDHFSAWDLKTLVFPSTLISIGEWCFNNMGSVESIFFGESLKSIGAYSFCNNENLETVVLPSSLSSIDSTMFKADENAAFSGCPKLCAVVTPGSKAESFCRERMIPYRYFFDRIWNVDSGEAEEALALSGADHVRIRMDKKSLELTYNLDGEPCSEVFPVRWKDGLLCMENGNMKYTLTDAKHLTLDMNGKELHLIRIEDRK